MLTSAVVVRVDDAAAARLPPPAKAPGVAAMLMGATTHGRSPVSSPASHKGWWSLAKPLGAWEAICWEHSAINGIFKQL